MFRELLFSPFQNAGGNNQVQLRLKLFLVGQVIFQLFNILVVSRFGQIGLILLEFISILAWLMFLGYIQKKEKIIGDGVSVIVSSQALNSREQNKVSFERVDQTVSETVSEAVGQVMEEAVGEKKEEETKAAEISEPVKVSVSTIKSIMTEYLLDENSQRIDWDTLMRNAQDGGANSVLACRILEKTTKLLSDGSKQVVLMVEAANAMIANTAQLEAISKDIKSLSDQARVVSINASIEAARAGVHGKVFAVVTTQMKDLSAMVAGMTIPINERLAEVSLRINQNKMLCGTVSGLFVSMNKEVKEFKNLMLRVEELATIQGRQLKSLEEKLKASREKLRKAG